MHQLPNDILRYVAPNLNATSLYALVTTESRFSRVLLESKMQDRMRTLLTTVTREVYAISNVKRYTPRSPSGQIHGCVYLYYNEILSSTAWYRNGRLHGYSESYNHGLVTSSTFYINDVRHGCDFNYGDFVRCWEKGVWVGAVSYGEGDERHGLTQEQVVKVVEFMAKLYRENLANTPI